MQFGIRLMTATFLIFAPQALSAQSCGEDLSDDPSSASLTELIACVKEIATENSALRLEIEESKRKRLDRSLFFVKDLCLTEPLIKDNSGGRGPVSLRVLIETLRDIPQETTIDDSGATIARALVQLPDIRVSLVDHLLFYYDRRAVAIYCSVELGERDIDDLTLSQRDFYNLIAELRLSMDGK